MRFPEFSGEWKSHQIKEIASIVGGGTPDTNVKEYWAGDINWYTPSEIGKTKYVNRSIRRISHFGVDNSSAKILPKGTILLSTRATIGEKSITETECCTNQGFQSVIPNVHTDTNFCYYALDGVKSEMIRRASGSTFLEISSSQLSSIHFRLTDIREQRKIGLFLSLIDERIETQSKIIEEQETLLKSLADSSIKALCDGQCKMVPFSELYERAGEGGTPSTSERAYYDNGDIPFIKIDDLKSKYITKHQDNISELGLKNSSAWIIPENSVIYSNGATIGAVSINTCPISTKQGILGVVPISMVYTEYLYYLMSSTYFAKEINRIVTEGTMKTAYLKDINNILCPLPPLDTQIKIAKELASLSERLEVEMRILEQYKLQKVVLLSRMFI